MDLSGHSSLLSDACCSIKYTKEFVVRQGGIGTDIHTSVMIFNDTKDEALFGSLCDRSAREVPLMGINHCRWFNLLRQVVTTIRPGAVAIATECLIDDYTEAIEVNLVMDEITVTRLLPYSYDAPTRTVKWADETGPEPASIERACAVELNAVYAASSVHSTASKHSIRYLTDECNVGWHGSRPLLDQIGLTDVHGDPLGGL